MVCESHKDKNVYLDGAGKPVCYDCMEQTPANARQVGGVHYRGTQAANGMQHWDVVHAFNLDYFQGNITKYLFRWKDKNGIQDLEKALHYLEKYLELANQSKASTPQRVVTHQR